MLSLSNTFDRRVRELYITIMMKQSEIYISVDIEASGSIPGTYSMLALGACVVGNTTENFYVELKPINDNLIPQALEVSGLSLKNLKKQGAEPKAAMKKFEKWIKKVSLDKRPVFVAFNATFDWMFTHWYFIEFVGRDPFGISGLDIKAYFMGMTKTKWKSTSKRHVRAQFPSRTKHTHNALDDAIEQAEIFEQMLR